MRKTDNNIMQEIMLTIMSDEYTTETAELMREVLVALHNYSLKTGESDHFIIMSDVAFKKIAEHEQRNRLKAEDLSDVFIKQLADSQLSELLDSIEEAGRTAESEEEKRKLRSRYIAVRKEMTERFEKE
nr:MAG TPA: hypothetical protein [Caudoviricetes sp.]